LLSKIRPSLESSFQGGSGGALTFGNSLGLYSPKRVALTGCAPGVGLGLKTQTLGTIQEHS
jgi:hypothetical protein